MLEKIKNYVSNMNKTKLYTMVTSIAVCGVILISVMISEALQNIQPKQIEVPEQLVDMEKQDAKEVDKAIETQRTGEWIARVEKQAGIAQEETGDPSESSIWGMFENYVFMGDSRCVGFSYYDFLRDDRVFAGGGNTIRDVLGDLDKLKEIAPSTLYLCYGLNDTGAGLWEDSEAYAEELRTVFDTLKKELPDTTIVASSILPATQEALERSPVWNKIGDFDAALKKVCEEKGVVYADNSELAAEHMNLYNEDGVHLNRAFYPLWAKNLYIAPILVQKEQG